MEEWLFIRAYNRFQEDYRERIRRKLTFLHFVPFKTKINLTLDPSKFNNLKEEFDSINKMWARLRSWLYKRFGRFFYLKVLEVQKTGHPHLHILTTITFVEWEDLKNEWEKIGGGWSVYIHSVSKDLKGLSYVLKYVNKCVYGSRQDTSYASLLFASNKRMYSPTRIPSLEKHHRVNVTQAETAPQYNYRGLVLSGSLEACCRESNIKFTDSIRIVPSPLELDLWQDIFGDYSEL